MSDDNSVDDGMLSVRPRTLFPKSEGIACAQCWTIQNFTDEDWNNPNKDKFAQDHMEKIHGQVK